MIDIVERLRASVTQCRALDRSAVLAEAANEIERLRITDAERTLICRLAAACEGGHPREWTNRALTADDRATLRGLLSRLKT